MARLLALPFALLLAVVSLGLIAGGVALFEDELAHERDDGRQGAFLDLDAFSGDDHEEPDPAAPIAGASLLGFGVLGLIAAIALLIVSLSGDREPVPVMAAPQQQQQQQQVVVVTHPDGRAEVHERR